MRAILLIVSLFFSGALFAYELNGSAESIGQGHYTVILHDAYGVEFNGIAVDQGNGVWQVTVHNKDGVTFTGIGMDNESDEYDLKLKDVATGNPANGILEEHFH
ncbi:MAG: hypothetical protein WAW86_09375 [Gammaproteobacteria bacterium]